MTLLLSFEMQLILVRSVLRKTRNRLYIVTTEYNSIFVFVFYVKFSIFKRHMSIKDANWTFATDVFCFIDHLSLSSDFVCGGRTRQICPYSLCAECAAGCPRASSAGRSGRSATRGARGKGCEQGRRESLTS